MFFLALVVFGARAYRNLPLNLLPDISYPTLTVEIEYPGTAPAEMESLVATPTEEALGTVPGVLRLESVSRVGRTTLTLEFAWGTDMDLAVLDVREKLDRVALPEEVESPRLLRYNPAQDPILRLAVVGDRPPAELRWIAEELVEKPVEGRPGVAAVKVLGGVEPEIEILVDEAAASAYGIGLDTIAQRLAAENINRAGGRLSDGGAEYLVRTLNEFRTLDEVRALMLREGPGGAVRLGDVATVRAGYKDREVLTYVDDAEAVFIDVLKTADSNTVAVARRVRERLGLLESDEARPESFPAGTRLVVVEDQSGFIQAAISAVRSAALLGGAAALLVLYLFLWDVRSTVIIGLAIPVSIIATFLPMYLGGISLNLMSLGGLAVGIGMLVDNAIVVLESITRRREAGDSPAEAAARGTREVAGAVTASTFTTCAVFVPIVFVEGVAAQIFTDLALTVVAALLTSLVVALLFIPMVAGRPMGLGAAERPRRTFRFGDARLGPLQGARAGLAALAVRVRGHHAASLDRVHADYARVLGWALRRPGVVLAVVVALVAHAALLVPRLGGELIPRLHQGLFTVELETALGTPIDRTAELVRPLARDIAALPGTTRVTTEVGATSEFGDEIEQPQPHVARIAVTLPAGPRLAERERAVQAAVRDRLATYPALEAELSAPALFSTAAPIEATLTGRTVEQLLGWSADVVEQLGEIPGVVDVHSTLDVGSPEVRVSLDRDRLRRLGIEPETVAEHLRRKIHGTVATRFTQDADRIDMRVRGAGGDRQTVEAVRQLIVNPGRPTAVRLASLATITVAPGPSEIRRIGQRRAAVVRANVAGRDLGSATDAIRQVLAQTPRPLSSTFEIGGQSREMRQAFASLRMALALAVFLVYVVLASQFESFRQPLLILLAIPLAAIGVLEVLTALGVPLSVVVFLGAIVLAGIVVNNAIVLVDAINLHRRGGASVDAAIRTAAHVRLRPILMTTLTTVLGLMPMTVARGPGAEIQRPLALTVMAGLLVSTALTLVVIPVFYRLAAGRRARRDAAVAPAEVA